MRRPMRARRGVENIAEYTAKAFRKPMIGDSVDLPKWLMVLAVTPLLACASRAPGDTFSVGQTPERRAASMNRAFLRPASPEERLVVHVDWIRGAEPRDAALSALGRFLRRATARPHATIEVVRGQEIERPAGNPRRALAEAARRNARPPEDAYYVYVVYWDRYEKYRGVYWPGGGLHDDVEHEVITMFVEPIERDSILWLTRNKVESAVLVHEFGHLAGLVRGGRDALARKQHRPRHCPNPACRMYWGVDSASVRANFLPTFCLGRLDLVFCGECEADLAAGRGD